VADDRAGHGHNQNIRSRKAETGKGPDESASYWFTTAASRLAIEPFAAVGGFVVLLPERGNGVGYNLSVARVKAAEGSV
jgi:hypothetical protein